MMTDQTIRAIEAALAWGLRVQLKQLSGGTVKVQIVSMKELRFKEIYDQEVLRLAFDEEIDVDIDGFRETLRRLSKEYLFSYERRKVSGR